MLHPEPTRTGVFNSDSPAISTWQSGQQGYLIAWLRGVEKFNSAVSSRIKTGVETPFRASIFTAHSDLAITPPLFPENRSNHFIVPRPTQLCPFKSNCLPVMHRPFRLSFSTIVLALALPLTSARAVTLLYVSNYGDNSISSIDSSGAVSTSTISSIDGPIGLAFNGSGELYAANTFTGSNEKIIARFSTTGSGSVFVNSGIDFPAEMAFDSGGNLFVADYGNAKIVKFDSSGNRTIFASTLNLPNGLAFDSLGNLYVSVQNQTIMKFTPDGVGSVFASTSSYGTILALAFDSLGNLFATSHGSTAQIVKFAPSGVGTVFATSNLSVPYGIAIDDSDNVYASFWGSSVITKYTPAGDSSFFANTGLYPTYLAFGDVGDASEFTFDPIAIPEPSRQILLIGGGFCLLLRRRRFPTRP